MLYNNYEDYMRNVLGYSSNQNNLYERFDNNYYNYDTYNCNSCNNLQNNMAYYDYNNMYNTQYKNRNISYDIEQMYPNIFRLINPMVCDMCSNNNQPITEDLVEQMTNNIYDNVVNRVEIQNLININIETTKSDNNRDIKEAGENLSCSRINSSSNRTSSSSSTNSANSSVVSSKVKENERQLENRSPVVNSRPRRNRLLQDLIRILILNQLSRPNRPPFRPGPGPMPPRPGFGMPPFN